MKYRVKRHTVVQPLDKPYRLIPLTRNQNAIVDVEDFEWLSEFTWCAQPSKVKGKFYPVTRIGKRVITMHAMILMLDPRELADHRNAEPCDNRRANIRKCTETQNAFNKSKSARNTTGYKGITWHKGARKWMSIISWKNEGVYLGLFESKLDAARAYDERAKELYGEFAHLNFPPMANENRNL